MNRRCLNCMKEFSIPEGCEGINLICPFCGYVEGTPPKEITYLYPGTILQNRYIIGTTLGAGGFGITYKAWDTSLNMIVAIKEYYPTGIVQRIPGQTDVIIYAMKHKREFEEGLERFLEEARKMAMFSTSKNIVHVESFFEENNTAYIVMEYLDGISVKDFLKQEGGKIDLQTMIDIILSVADALNEIHSVGILHRDISPDNVFICEGDNIKVLDFGAARLSDEEKEVTRSIILKPGYAPPEQYQSKSKQGPWTDIYALSAMMYKGVTGIMPDESTNRKEEDKVIAPKDVCPEIPEYISNTIMKGMALNSELRFHSISEFKKALLNEKKVLDEKAELKKRKKRRVITIIAAVFVMLAGGFVAWKIYDSKDPILNPSTITVWVAYSEDEEPENVQKMVMDMSKSFMEEQAAVDVVVEAIPESQYEEKLQEAYKSGDMPTVYETNYASDAICADAESVRDVYENIDDISEYYFLDSYKDDLISEKEVPLGFNVPVAYVRRSDDYDVNTVKVEQYEDISNSGYYISQEYIAMQLKTLGAQLEFKDKMIIDEKAKQILNDYLLLYKNDTNYSSNISAVQSFAEGSITYYLASVKELKMFNEGAVGLYEMRPMMGESVCGEFTDMLSISGSADKDEIAAAKVWLRYMLEEGPQKTMHIVNKNSIPLQKDAYATYISNNSKLHIIDGYLDNIKFYPVVQKKEHMLMDDMWNKVIVNQSEDVEQWLNEQQ